MKWRLSLILLAALLLPHLDAADPVDFGRDIKPLLAQQCVSCHGPAQQKAGLRLDSGLAILRGGASGPAVVAGKSDQSLLLKALTAADGLTLMPYKKPPLAAEQIALVKHWIDQGAKYPADEVALDALAAKKNHWAFQAPSRPVEPGVRATSWVRNAIDRFILARLEREGITPAPEADRATLIRRLCLDLLGLPPTLQEAEAFLEDTQPDAYERLVDRLLASPHYGERWGRRWLDLARYADSNGFNIDAPREIWKYRDWVIDALNRDLPFDQFAIEQLAGDLLPKATLEQRIATGFHRNTLINQEGGIDKEQFRVESVVDRVNTTGSVFLGLTVGCAQCHDHKYDPITQREYYQLFAFFNNADEPTLELPTPDQVKERQRVRSEAAALQRLLRGLDATSPARQAEWEKNLPAESRAVLSKEINEILALADDSRTAKQKQVLAAVYRKLDQMRHVVGGFGEVLPASLFLAGARTTLEKRIADLKKREPDIVTTMVMQERVVPRETHLHINGDFTRKGLKVSPGVPDVLPPLPSGGRSNRLDAARWLVNPRNPLTARVTMNRIWQEYFGTGLVETANDFGLQGTPPSHAELLDWLAAEFVARGWSMKALHRLMVTSATYRQSSRYRPELAVKDPNNRLLARQTRLRLDAEIVRDASLSASGLLHRKLGGPSVFPPQPEGIFRFTQVQKEWRASPGAERHRRGLYTHFWRSAPHPALMVFDAPESTTTCTRRNRSNTPLQALTLLNDQAFLEFAQGLALRVLRESLSSDRDRLQFAFRACLTRGPTERELDRLAQLLQDQLAEFTAAPAEARLFVPNGVPAEVDVERLAAWTAVARVLLNLDEFITRE